MTSLPTVNVGDSFIHPRVNCFGKHVFQYKFVVLGVEKLNRFGKPDLLLTVQISAVYTDGTERITDSSTLRWLSAIATVGC